MAEIRKHNPQIRDEIDKAIHAALGEDIRPVQQHEWQAKGEPHEDTGERPAAGTSPAVSVTPFATFAPGVGASGWTPLDASKLAKPLGVHPADPDEDELDED